MGGKRLVISLLLGVLLGLPVSSIASAATPINKGLLITPVRQIVSVNAGTPKAGSFSIANLTAKPIVANLSVKQFSVTDIDYDYRFNDPDNDWLKLSITQIDLKPNASQKINYTIDAPAGSKPGGHYYTLLATANLSNKSVGGTVQAASLLYLTVNGKLIQTSRLESTSIKHWVFGNEIPYSFVIKNTGNVHYFVYLSASLHGPFTKNNISGSTHLVLPGTRRAITGALDSPVLPGIYKLQYGYKTDIGTGTSGSTLLIYTPLWSIVAAALILMLIARTAVRRLNRS